MKIYFKTRKKPENIKDIKELLKSGYTKTQYGGFKKTFKNPELTIPECHSARRSFGDLLYICRTYFPKTTEKELAKTIFELNQEIGLGASICGTIQKTVFVRRAASSPIDIYVCNKAYRGKGKYSLDDIQKLSQSK